MTAARFARASVRGLTELLGEKIETGSATHRSELGDRTETVRSLRAVRIDDRKSKRCEHGRRSSDGLAVDTLCSARDYLSAREMTLELSSARYRMTVDTRQANNLLCKECHRKCARAPKDFLGAGALRGTLTVTVRSFPVKPGSRYSQQHRHQRTLPCPLRSDPLRSSSDPEGLDSR
jgi:hypothetical protein